MGGGLALFLRARHSNLYRVRGNVLRKCSKLRTQPPHPLWGDTSTAGVLPVDRDGAAGGTDAEVGWGVVWEASRVRSNATRGGCGMEWKRYSAMEKSPSVAAWVGKGRFRLVLRL